MLVDSEQFLDYGMVHVAKKVEFGVVFFHIWKHVSFVLPCASCTFGIVFSSRLTVSIFPMVIDKPDK